MVSEHIFLCVPLELRSPLVTQVVIGASNYTSWSKSMLIPLSGKNKLGFTTGVIAKPKGSLLATWQ